MASYKQKVSKTMKIEDYNKFKHLVFKVYEKNYPYLDESVISTLVELDLKGILITD